MSKVARIAGKTAVVAVIGFGIFRVAKIAVGLKPSSLTTDSDNGQRAEANGKLVAQ